MGLSYSLLRGMTLYFLDAYGLLTQPLSFLGGVIAYDAMGRLMIE